jgi:beta-lactamase class D
MATTEELIERLKAKHNGDTDNLIAWFIGYVQAAERDLNNVRKALNVDHKKTLAEYLGEEIDEEKPF